VEIDTPGNGVPIYVDSRKGRPFDLSVVTPTKYSVSALAGGPRGGKTYEMAGRKAKGEEVSTIHLHHVSRPK
jgi:hypothetical protein